MKKRLPVLLIIDEHHSSRQTIKTVLASQDINTLEAVSADEARSELNRVQPDLIVVDPDMRGCNGLEFTQSLHERFANVPIIVITENRESRVVVEAMRQGMHDCLHKPVNATALLLSVNRALDEKRIKDELLVLKGKLSERTSLRLRMGDSDKVQALIRILEKIAPTPFTVLIEGESGAGKELVARAIHESSRVRDGQFVAVDCGAIPDNLFESELFGYVKGAFTGASGDKTGFFEAADNGTLFLDEVCNLSYTAQQKLLRVIEERKVQKIGTTVARPVNVRIVAASNRPLEKETENRLFRVDLLHRLKEVSVKVPPLRERSEDIPYLAARFLEEFRENLNIRNPGLSPEAVRALMRYSWPGNVRELKNIMRQAALTCEEDQTVQPCHLSIHSTASAAQEVLRAPGVSDAEIDAMLAAMPATPLADIVGENARRLERRLIERAIESAGGNKSAAAKRLGIDYTTLHRKRKQLGIA